MSYYQVCKKSVTPKSLIPKALVIWGFASVYAQCPKGLKY